MGTACKARLNRTCVRLGESKPVVQSLSRRGIIALISAVKKQAEKDIRDYEKYNARGKASWTYLNGDIYLTAKWWMENRLPIYQELLPELCNKSKEIVLHSEEY